MHAFVRRTIALFMLGAVATPALAGPDYPYVFNVGSDATCQFDTIQEAVDEAERIPGLDYIHIANNLTYTAQAIRIGRQDVTIVGGYTSCAASDNFETPTGMTVISGAGGSQAPVFEITGSGVRELAHLFITGGDTAGSGGGIYYNGTGVVRISDTAVSSNRAANGAGVFASSNGGPAFFEFGPRSLVVNNVATNNGGGFYLAGSGAGSATTFRMLADDTTIHANRAGNSGGGLFISGEVDAVIASAGYFGGLPAISQNTAVQGGGVAIISRDKAYARLTTFANPQGKPVGINGNIATSIGGAIYAKPYISQGVFGSITTQRVDVDLGDFVVSDNRAPNGAAFYLDEDSTLSTASLGGSMRLNHNRCNVPLYACNRVERNIVTSTTGAVAQLDSDSDLAVNLTTFSANEGAFLFRVSGETQLKDLSLRSCLLTGNVIGTSMVKIDRQNSNNSMINCTVASNNIGGSVFEATQSNAKVVVENSILAQPEDTLFFHVSGLGAGKFVTANNIVPTILSLPPADTTSIGAPPRFVDEAFGDFRLRPGSFAVDFVEALAGNDLDLDNLPRDLDFTLKADLSQPRDAGAYEYQNGIQLIVNGEFSKDLRAWRELTIPGVAPGYVTHAAGGSEGGTSGSLVATIPGSVIGDRFDVAHTCVTLPKEGFYALTGLAYSVASAGQPGDTPVLEWAYRDQTGDCDPGKAIVASGEVAIPLGGWQSPLEAPVIDATSKAAFPTFGTSIEVRLKLVRNPQAPASDPITASFDKLSLVKTDGPTALLSDSFE